MTVARALRLACGDLYQNSWRLLVVNAALGAVLVFSAVAAIAVHELLVLAVLTLYLVVLLGIYAVVLTTVAVAEPGEPLRIAARRAATVWAQRPGATLLLGLALLLVNLAGIAAAVMPFLTITVA